jgi:surface antigen
MKTTIFIALLIFSVISKPASHIQTGNVKWSATLKAYNHEKTIINIDLTDKDEEFVYANVKAIIKYSHNSGQTLRTDTLAFTTDGQRELIGGQRYKKTFDNRFSIPITVTAIRLIYVEHRKGMRISG